MDVEKILLALEERDRWIERELELEKELRNTPRKERAARKPELELIKAQVTYYDALARDMKKTVRPSRLSHLMNSLVRF